ncbi:MAG: hypothetical protein LBM70_07685 [Victivallales bacterium]|nr:hypothetical protein [Victivallales bacterium]
MNLLKKHYEKLILLLLLLIFIGLMFHVLSIVKQTGEIQDHHLQIPTREPDYKVQDPKSPTFDVSKIFENTRLSWVNPGAREKSAVYTDLAYVFKIAYCPFCKKLIPRKYMEEQDLCPFCKNHENKGAGFAKPPEDSVKVVIPEEIRRKYNLDETDLDSDYYDLDGDGFSNIYEYMMQTDMGKARNHPPFWHRLRVIEMGKIVLPINLKSVNMMDSDDPKQWELQVETDRMVNFYSIGGELEIDGTYFKIENVGREAGKAADGKDLFTLELKEVDGDRTLTLATGGVIRSLTDKAVLQDVFNLRKYTVAPEGTFNMGDRRTGSEGYRVKSFDLEEGSVLLESSSSVEGEDPAKKPEEQMIVTGSGKISPLFMVKVPKPKIESEMPGENEFSGAAPRNSRPNGRR